MLFRDLSRARIFVALSPVDMRKQIDGIAGCVYEQLSEDALNGCLYVFFGKGYRKVKILYWDGDGFTLWYKRKLRGSFNLLVKNVSGKMEVNYQELENILTGKAVKEKYQDVFVGRKNLDG